MGDGLMPSILAALSHIDRFGVDAVYGRSLSVDEIVWMRTAENIVNFTRSHMAAKDKEGGWGKWMQDNPIPQEIVAEARRCAIQEGLIDE